ncbi:hypothetical protein [Flavisolibacter nicotianae]|uniref:hypothetical protein n=1 Tax=Flavisolibacter nicotianae TaxID=2364882 RepID=UPI000EAB55C8|nr:hypothetical protein [Flavisolibacter nicotianae]
MKKCLLLLIPVLLVLACSRKTVPASRTKANENIPPRTYNASAVAQGRVVYTNRCGRCHGLKPVQKYSAQEWEPILTVMIRKARLQAADSVNVSAYVFSGAKGN